MSSPAQGDQTVPSSSVKTSNRSTKVGILHHDPYESQWTCKKMRNITSKTMRDSVGQWVASRCYRAALSGTGRGSPETFKVMYSSGVGEYYALSEMLLSVVGEAVMVPYPTSVIGILLSVPDEISENEPLFVSLSRSGGATHMLYLEESRTYLPGKLYDSTLDTTNFVPFQGGMPEAIQSPDFNTHFTIWFGPTFRFVLMKYHPIKLSGEAVTTQPPHQ